MKRRTASATALIVTAIAVSAVTPAQSQMSEPGGAGKMVQGAGA